MNKVSFALLISGVLLGTGFGYVMGAAQAAPEADMEHAMDQMTASLEGKTGDEFDRTFLREMIVHHEGAVAMARQVLETSEREELRVLAEAIISAQEGEIAQMEAWQNTWFGTSTNHPSH